MFSIKLLIWLSIYLILYILFSLNTLISIFCFIIVIILTCLLLLKIHVEYLTFLILLLYLGGILIFFLFTTLMLGNEYDTTKNGYSFSIENIILFLFFCKSFFFVSILNQKIIELKSINTTEYESFHIINRCNNINLISTHGDFLNLISLYSDKYILLYILGMILLFTMMGVIVITKNKYV